jgi:prepilin signal peptidase PulO-like enzyme (type II secretory pathway)
MNSLIVACAFVFFLGASVASFLQMYLDTGGKNLWRGINNGSTCDGCGTKLNWFYLMPVLGSLVIYIFNSGKTKCCGQNLSWKYLLGEVILGLWFVGSYNWFWVPDLWINPMFYLCLFFLRNMFVSKAGRRIIPFVQ